MMGLTDYIRFSLDTTIIDYQLLSWLDPFGGSGTVAKFCCKNDRDCTIFELNPEYEVLIKERAMINYPTLDIF